jgi:hypothetical protein
MFRHDDLVASLDRGVGLISPILNRCVSNDEKGHEYASSRTRCADIPAPANHGCAWRAGKPTGKCTHGMVSLGAALSAVVSMHGFGRTGDPARSAAQIASGTAFLAQRPSVWLLAWVRRKLALKYEIWRTYASIMRSRCVTGSIVWQNVTRRP